MATSTATGLEPLIDHTGKLNSGTKVGNAMEHEQRVIHKPSSSTTADCSTSEELDGASSSVCTSVEESTSSRYWTSIESASDSDDEGYVRTLPGRDVQKYNMGQIKLLEKIGEGGQGTIYTAQLFGYKMLSTYLGQQGQQANVVVAKVYRGRSGQWPEYVFHLHLLSKYICEFYGYCLEGESFYLIMRKYDCSLRDLLDLMMANEWETRPLSENDLQMEKDCKRRPFADITAILVIMQIALGMCFLHENNILHRDLKADNVFVTVHSGEVIVRIGDFDVASRVVGTLFWRAPEILQALKEGKHPVFTPKADVYSYAMTCYEILTGDVPLEGIRASDYDSVLQRGMRPQLPSNLNPKLKDLMSRSWHQDPESRPTFKEIVVELKELHRELIIGLELVSRDSIFNDASSSVDNEASPEACLLELKALLQALLVKYGQEDFLLLGLEFVADLEQYQLEFGLRSFKEDPELPYSEYMKRHMLYDRMCWKLKLFRRVSPIIVASYKIAHLLGIITIAVSENCSSVDYTAVQSESLEWVNISDLKESYQAWKEECDALVLPKTRHAVCSEIPQQACDVCKSIGTEATDTLNLMEEALQFKFRLYVEKDLESEASSLRECIRAPSSLRESYRTMLLATLLSDEQ